MASPISCLSILIIPLLVTSLFYDVSNASRALLEKVCNKAKDPAYCVAVLLTDPEGLTDVLYRLGLAATSVSLTKIQDYQGEIGNVLAQVNDQDTKNRITGCQSDIDIVYGDMEQAYTAAGTQSFTEEVAILVSAQAKITNCINRFAAPPTMQSPIASSTSNIEKLINICDVIAKMLQSS